MDCVSRCSGVPCLRAASRVFVRPRVSACPVRFLIDVHSHRPRRRATSSRSGARRRSCSATSMVHGRGAQRRTARLTTRPASLGWVVAQAGYYTDAIKNKKNTVVALIAENFGGVTPAVTALLRRLAKRSCADTTK